MEDWRSRFGAKVRSIRLDRGITQEALAGSAEIDLTYLGGIERGRRNPSLLVIVRIASALEIEPGVLFDGPDEPV